MSLDQETRIPNKDPQLSENQDPLTETRKNFKEIAISVMNNSNTRTSTETEPIRTNSVTRPQIYTNYSPNREAASPSDEDHTRSIGATISNELVQEVTPNCTDFNPTQLQRIENTSPKTTSPLKDFKKNIDGDLPPQIFGGYSPTRPVQYDSSPTRVAPERPQTLPVVVNYIPGTFRSDCPLTSPDSTDGSIRLESNPSTPSTQLRLHENQQEITFSTPPPPYSALDTSRNVITTQPQINYVNRDGLQKGIIYSARPRTLTCPYCLRQVLTNHKKEIGIKVHLVGIGCLLLGCMPLCVLAYVMDYLKDDNHYCPACGRMIGTEVPVAN